MKSLTEFSIPLAIASWRKRLRKSGVFTHDNLDELESHLIEGIDTHRKDYEDEQAFVLAEKRLGNQERLIESYSEENRVLIWRNFLRLTLLSTLIWWLLYHLMNKGMYGLLLVKASNESLSLLLLGISFFMVLVFTCCTFLGKNRISKVIGGLQLFSFRSPGYLFFLLLLLPLRFLINSAVHLIPVEHYAISASVQNSFGLFIAFFYMLPLVVLIVKLTRYQRISDLPLASKLKDVLSICFFSGAFLAAIFHQALQVFGSAGTFLLYGNTFGLAIETSILIAGIVVFLLCIVAVYSFYLFPERSIAKIKQLLISASGYRLLALLCVPLISFSNIWIKGQLPNYLLSGDVIPFYTTWTYLNFGTELIACIALILWSFYAIKKKQVIAWG